MPTFSVDFEDPVGPGSVFEVAVSSDMGDHELRLVRQIVDQMLED